MKMCDCQSVSLLLLTRGSHLMPSNLVLVLQCLSGAYSNFVAKISGIDTLLLLCNIQLYFPQYSFGLTIPLV